MLSRSQVRKKYRAFRSGFKRDLYEVAMQNRVIPVMIIKTYAASQHRTHIMKIWSLLGMNHREAYKDYCDKLVGKHLTGNDDMRTSLYFACPEIYKKYHDKMPEAFLMGDAYSVALNVMKKLK